MSDTALNYQKLLTETLQSQIVILGSEITLAKARHVPGLHFTDDGRVTGIDGNPQEVSIKLLEQFRELSPLMVKKTMRPLLDAIIIQAGGQQPQQATETKHEEESPKEQNDHQEQKVDQPTEKTPTEETPKPEAQNQTPSTVVH